MKSIVCMDCNILTTIDEQLTDQDAYCPSCREDHSFCRNCGEELLDEYHQNEGYCHDCI